MRPRPKASALLSSLLPPTLPLPYMPLLPLMTLCLSKANDDQIRRMAEALGLDPADLGLETLDTGVAQG